MTDVITKKTTGEIKNREAALRRQRDLQSRVRRSPPARQAQGSKRAILHVIDESSLLNFPEAVVNYEQLLEGLTGTARSCWKSAALRRPSRASRWKRCSSKAMASARRRDHAAGGTLAHRSHRMGTHGRRGITRLLAGQRYQDGGPREYRGA